MNGTITEADSRPGVDVRRPRARAVGPVPVGRVLAGTTAVVLAAVAATIMVQRAPATGWASAMTFATGLVVIPLVASPLEWFVHRFVYHEAVLTPLGPIATVHAAHHHAYFPTWRYVTGGPARRLAIRRRAPSIHTVRRRNAGVRATHTVWYLSIGALFVWTPAWVATRDRAYLAGLVVASCVVSNLFIVVHDTIHRPGSHRLVEAQPWFAFLDRHHYVHHVDLGANLNFLLPLADWLFGTLRTGLTAEELAEHGSLEAAKALRRGAGERALAGVGRVSGGGTGST